MPYRAPISSRARATWRYADAVHLQCALLGLLPLGVAPDAMGESGDAGARQNARRMATNMNWTTAQAAQHFARLGIINPVESACGQQPKRSKYNVDLSPAGKAKRTCDGILFGSEAEMRAYKVLRIAAGHGLISDLKLQPRYVLQEPFTDGQGTRHRAVAYVGDFYFIREGKRVVVEVKGVETAAYKVKAKMFRAKYPDIILEVWR